MKLNKLKDTGTVWLPKIPENWELLKVRHLFKERIQKGCPDEKLLVASQEHGVVSKETFGKRTMEATKDFHLLKLVEKGDFVISLRSFQGGIELAHERGIISPAYTILREIKPMNKRYFKYLFKSSPFISLMQLCVKGIRDGQNIDIPTFRSELLPLPPIQEQNIIADYLDNKITQIDKFIRNKEKFIKLLDSQRWTFIEKIIFGSNNFIKTKPLKYWVSKVGSGVTPLGGATVYVSEGIPFLRSQNIHFGGLKLDDVAYITEETHKKMKFSRVQGNDVLLNITGASIGRCCAIGNDLGEANVNQHVCVIRPKKELDSKFLAYFLSSIKIQNLIRNSQDGASREGLNYSEIKSFPIPEINLKQQIEIVNILEEKEVDINVAIIKAKQEIAAIKEYREALITDLVTGKRSIEYHTNIVKHPELMEETI